MFLLLGFAFLAGIVTILSPCILPVLPIILTSTIGGEKIGKRRPIGVVIGFVLSFTFFTLFISTIVRLSGLSADFLRLFSIIVIVGFGVSFLIPSVQTYLEGLFSRLAGLLPQTSERRMGFGGGLLIGLSLGLLWTPCVGPILASVISLALIGNVTFQAFLITFAYSLGTAIPMFLIMLGGQTALKKVPWLLKNTAKIQRTFGVIMIFTAVAIFFNLDRRFQTYILNTFPSYGVGLTNFEDNEAVKNELKNINNSEVKKEDMGKPTSDLLPKGPPAPEIIPGGQWFNSKPLKLSELRGKVVIVDFWTYSCINCQRTLPYLKNWYEKYSDKGLVIIGVHSPEFEFEKNPKNVAEAIKDFKLGYPVVQDNDFATWRAYENHYWPAKYIIDKDGFIRYTHFGEGAYDETERVIQELLNENSGKSLSTKINNPSYDIYSRTPELYLGYGRIEYLASPQSIKKDSLATYSSPETLSDNLFSYVGDWEIMEEYANPKKGAYLYLNFEAKDVYLVMRAKKDTAKVRVFVDEKEQFFGEDNKDGIVTVDSDRLYKLIKLPSPGRHLLRLQFEDDNAEIFAFTFG